MIEVRGLKKTFDGFAALDGADLSVPRGAVYGLVGPNGAGKTTLLRHLTGVYRQDEGSVRFDGEEVWENAGVKARIASIPDDWFYFMQAGLRDMMRFYRGLYPKFDQERFEKLREVFALDEKRPLRRMSKGQQKQAAFWLAMCAMPDYLILDEPVDGLDPVMRRQVWSLILQDVAERGTTVLVSSHNLRELEDVCDHVGVMSRGKLLLEHSLSELQDYTVKLQLAFEGAELPALPQEIKVLHHAQTGRVHTLICRGSAEDLEQQLAALRAAADAHTAARIARDGVVPAMQACREHCDALERMRSQKRALCVAAFPGCRQRRVGGIRGIFQQKCFYHAV